MWGGEVERYGGEEYGLNVVGLREEKEPGSWGEREGE